MNKTIKSGQNDMTNGQSIQQGLKEKKKITRVTNAGYFILAGYFIQGISYPV